MSNVLREWTQTTSGELCEYITSGSRDWKKYYSDEGALFIRTQDINTDKLNLSDVARVKLPAQVEGKRSRLQPGDLLITITGANVGKVAIVPDDLPEAYVSQSVGLMRLRDKRFGKYVHYYLQGERSGRQHVMKMVYGMGRPVLSLQNLRDIPIPLAQLDEQYEIVAEIEKQFTRLDAGVAGLRRVQANLKRYRAAVLKAACEGKLVPTEAELARQEGRSYENGAQLLDRILTEHRHKWNGKQKYKEPAKVDTTNLSPLPEGWAWASLDQIGQSDRPIIYGIIKPGPHVSSGVPYVRVTEMKDGRIDVPNLRRTSPERAAKFARATLAPGDVLISKDGTIGRVAVVPPELAGGNITQHVMRAPINAEIFRDYIVWAIRSDSCQRWLTGETRGVALRGVNVEDFRRLPVPVPSFTEEQRIVAEVERRVSVVEELEAAVNTNLQRTTRLRQSILQQAFEGKLFCAEARLRAAQHRAALNAFTD